ncbi:uncharacterized protein LOC108330138 [Vigna angularis]|uniref:uncharacterized protein LOC108330138 n=1 Tax=Phaseolus angularis TaxID=3914 RepID=UPI000809D8BC|nr:uncharacterized protein LOC108330138 [Vigna angularis]
MLLHQCVSATIFQKVSKAGTTKEIWDILQEGYGNISKVKKIKLQSLQRQYELLGMGEQESIVEYIGRIQVVVNSMRACDKVVKDKKIVEKILRTLTPQYDHIVVAIEDCKDVENMKVEELQNLLEAHEQHLLERKKAENEMGSNQALLVRSSFKPRGRGAGRSRGRWGGKFGGRSVNVSDQVVGEECNDNKRGRKQMGGRGRKNVDKRNIQCYTCSKYGHYSSECWHNETAKKNKEDEVNLAQDGDVGYSDSDNVLLMSVTDSNKEVKRWELAQERCWNRCKTETCSKDKCREIEMRKNEICNEDRCQEVNKHVLISQDSSHAEKEDSWYLDMGCSNHMTGKKE